MSRFLAAAILLLLVLPARAEDGYDLWLRYRPIEARAVAAALIESTLAGAPGLRVLHFDELASSAPAAR